MVAESTTAAKAQMQTIADVAGVIMAQETAVVADVVEMGMVETMEMGVMVGMATVVAMAIHPMADMVAEEVEDFLMAHTKENLMTHIRRENTTLRDLMCLKSPMRRHRINLM